MKTYKKFEKEINTLKLDGQYSRYGFIKKSPYTSETDWNNWICIHEYPSWQRVPPTSKYDKERSFLYVEWSTGGLSGGSCWGGEPSYYTSNDSEGELTSLDIILEHFCPTITFLQYRALCNKLITVGTRNENEYYGNSTNYRHKKIALDELYEYMVEKEWIN